MTAVRFAAKQVQKKTVQPRRDPANRYPIITMKFILVFALTALSAVAKAQTQFSQLRTSDGDEIQVCTRYPDSTRFPGARPAIMVLMGSGISDACGGKVGGGKYVDGLLDKGIVIFAKQKRGIQHDPKTGTYTADFVRYAKSDFPTLKSDTLQAFEFLMRDPRVDSKRTALWGISEGTILATHLALHHPEVKEMDLVSSVVEDFSALYHRQIYELLPKDLMEIYDTNHDGFLSSSEITNLFLVDSGLHTFKNIDTDGDKQLSEKELSAEIKRVVAESLIKKDDTFFLSKLGGSVSGRWVQSAMNLQALTPQILNLKVPTYLHHGTADSNTSVQPLYSLEKRAKAIGKLNLRFRYYRGLAHQLSPQIIVKSMLETAERLVK